MIPELLLWGFFKKTGYIRIECRCGCKAKAVFEHTTVDEALACHNCSGFIPEELLRTHNKYHAKQIAKFSQKEPVEDKRAAAIFDEFDLLRL